ncbi:50S ribosomal protein L25 [Candidatus Falkowbacteria bacterium CG10_big_fil_rev_8_21_14_0_10_43_11]|uniref:Large ribosomal subunit protein bL25 n=1 Tax=Candidatus Falkowbacteria bacterium CG10_big_fil_rev_8_21_14_0_10_43_11 TaxID=1974568 RepID=A0A2M6WKY8_9BACT|nr:MAG: 50S ribosomal protein L25 [Candidatus Falkowbacteria bacterium CG10_big_fil_rev_8_21_14_0_10_43_11]
MTQLKAKTRTKELSANDLRREGAVPAVAYCKGNPALSLAVNGLQLEKLYEEAGESSLVDLVLDDGQSKKVLIHDIQRDPMKSKIIHADFYEVDLKEKLTAAVEIELTGEAPIVKSEGGVIIKRLNEVEIECLPGDLLHKIEVDISVLNSFDSAIHVKDLRVPAAVKILNDAEEIVVNVSEPKEEEVEAPVAEAAVPVEGEAAVPAGEGEKAEGKKEESKK